MNKAAMENNDVSEQRIAQQRGWNRKTTGGQPPRVPTGAVLTDPNIWSNSQSGVVTNDPAPYTAPGSSALGTNWSSLVWSLGGASQHEHPMARNPHTPPVLYALLGDEASKFVTAQTAADGNCLFDSVRIILQSLDMNYTVRHLRSVVAYQTLDTHDKQTTETIASWITLYRQGKAERNFEMCQEYAHVEPVSNSRPPLSIQDRKKLSREMMKNTYWGDEHALRVLEERLCMRFLILHPDGSTQHPLDHRCSAAWRPDHVAMLLLSQKHYQPISYEGRYVFCADDLPPAVHKVFVRRS